MVLFFTATLGVSLLGMILLLWLKHYELTTGRVVFSGVRPLVGELLAAFTQWFQHRAPALAARVARRAWEALLSFLHRAVARGALWAEYALEHILRTVREKTTHARPGGEASDFLRQVAEHKKTLQRHRGQHTTIE